MTIGKATTLALGFAGAVAVGVWIGPYVTDRSMAAREPVVDATPTASPEAAAARTAEVRRNAPADAFASIPASSPDLQKRLQPVLNEGANVTLAARGFHNGEQFAAVAHAARNTGVPFAVLKHRVLVERKSLAEAIREMKPGVDAAREANRARIMARADLAAIAAE